MVTIQQARINVQKVRQQFEQRKRQVQQTRLRERTVRQKRAATPTDLAKRKAESMGFTVRKQESLRQLSQFEKKLKTQESIISQAEQQQRIIQAQIGKQQRDIAIAKKAVASGKFIGLTKEQRNIASNLREAQTSFEKLKERSTVIKEELALTNIQFKELGAEQ